MRTPFEFRQAVEEANDVAVNAIREIDRKIAAHNEEIRRLHIDRAEWSDMLSRSGAAVNPLSIEQQKGQ